MAEQLSIENTEPRKLALRGVNARVMEVLKITRVDELFTFLPAESAASGTTP